MVVTLFLLPPAESQAETLISQTSLTQPLVTLRRLPAPHQDESATGDQSTTENDSADDLSEKGGLRNDASNIVVEEQRNQGFLIQVPLPITLEVDSQIQRTIGRVLEQLPPAGTSRERPVIVLEFNTVNGATGEGSQLERCLALARYLTGPELNRVRTVAYVPAPRGVQTDQGKAVSYLSGHAVLVAIACEELVLHEDAALGAAGRDERLIDDLLRSSYRSIAERRRTLPIPLVMSLLDKQLALHRVVTAEGVLYLDQAELEALEAEGRVTKSDTLSDRGSFPEFSSDELDQFNLIPFKSSGRLDLARRLGIEEEAMMGDPSLGEAWRAVMIRLVGPISASDVSWRIQALQNAVDNRNANLIVVELDSSGGDLTQAIRLAQQIAELDSTKVRTVAYVPGRARGGAAVIALACDHLLMHDQSQLGGIADPAIDPARLPDIRPALKAIAQANERDLSPFLAVLDPAANLSRYRNSKTGRVRLLIDSERQELENAEDWIELSQVDLSQGISGATAERIQLSRYLVSSFDELRTLYQIEETPELLEPSASHQWIEEFGRRLSSPWIAGWLLFAAMFYLSTEVSQPGLGLPGFASAVCFLLFFWSQYCGGNVQLFEILLLMLGIAFLAIELLVIPGFGIFGVGGILMILASLFLAMQNFALPQTAEDYRQLPKSIAVLFAGVTGVFVAFSVVRYFAPHIPILNRMILEPPDPDGVRSGVSSASGKHHELVDQPGTAITRLAPSGKVQVGQEVVNVVTDGRFVEKGETIVVNEVHGNRIVVGPADLTAPSAASSGTDTNEDPGAQLGTADDASTSPAGS